MDSWLYACILKDKSIDKIFFQKFSKSCSGPKVFLSRSRLLNWKIKQRSLIAMKKIK